MSNRIEPTVKGVAWVEISKEPPFKSAPITQRAEYDLAVVGAGYCGLSIAHHAASLGLSVLLLEAGTVGCGASGRNGGFVVPHLPGGLTPDDLENELGKRKADRLSDLVSGGAAHVFEKIREHQIQCDAEQNGWIQPAHSQKALGKIERVFEAWRRRNVGVNWLSAQEIALRTGATGYIGGWYGPTGGTVNPYALAQGLARIAASQGVSIIQHAPVLAIRDGSASKVLVTNQGEHRARKVVFATNGYTPSLYPNLPQSVIPVRLFHVFTRRLSEEELARTLPERIPFTDLRKSGGFCRLTADGRVVSGGAVFVASDIVSYGKRHAAKRIADIFPHLTGIEIEHYWEGYCALTDTYLPCIQRLDRNVYSVIGFSTRGVALTQTLGSEIADFLAESKTEDEMPVRVGPVQRIALQPLKEFLGGFAFPVYQARDRLGLS